MRRLSIPASPRTSPRRDILSSINVESLSRALSAFYYTLQFKPELEATILLKISTEIRHVDVDYDEIKDWIIRKLNISLQIEEIQNLVLFVKTYSSILPLRSSSAIEEDYRRILESCSLVLNPDVDVKQWGKGVKKVEKNYQQKIIDCQGRPTTPSSTTFFNKIRRGSSSNKVQPFDKYSFSRDDDDDSYRTYSTSSEESVSQSNVT